MPQATLSSARDAIAKQYPESKYPDVRTRVAEVIRDVSFTCNTRQLFDAYHDSIPTYMMEFGFGLTVFQIHAVHGMDVAPTFWNAEVDYLEFIEEAAGQIGMQVDEAEAELISFTTSVFAPKYQSYLLSHTIFGDPNNGSYTRDNWPTAKLKDDGRITNVQHARVPSLFLPFLLIDDNQNSASSCDFWTKIGSEIKSTSAKKMLESSAQVPIQIDHAVNYEL